MLDAMEELEPGSEQIAGYLRQLATRLLCTEQHQKQVEEKVSQWSMKIHDVAVQFRRERTLLSQIQRLKNELQECKDLSKNRSRLIKQSRTELGKKDEELEAKSIELADICDELAAKSAELDEKCAQLEGVFEAHEEKSTELEEKSIELEEKSIKLAGKSIELAEKSIELEEKSGELVRQNRAYGMLEIKVADLQARLANSQPLSQNLMQNGQTQTTPIEQNTANQTEFSFDVNSDLTSKICARDRTIAELNTVLKKVDDILDSDEDGVLPEAGQELYSGFRWLGHAQTPPPRSVLKISQLRDQVRELKFKKTELSEHVQKLTTDFLGAELQIASCNVSIILTF